MKKELLGRTLRRLLEPTDKTLLFHSADPDDPRLGNLVQTLDSPERTTGLSVVILGVPQHKGVERNNGRHGADEAPTAIRRALYKMALSAIQDTLATDKLAVIDIGNIKPDGLTLEQIHDEVHDVVSGLLRANMIPIVLGGGHDVAWPTLRAYETIGEAYGVINIDAHTDVRPLIDGRAHSGSPFRQMLDTPGSCLAPNAFVEFGIQPNSVAKAHVQYVHDHGGSVVLLDLARKPGAWQKAMATVQNACKLHVSLDMDAFASAFAPGVSAPSSDGFVPWEIAPALRQAATSEAFSSFDVVEVNPLYDIDNRTSKLAALMIMQVISGVADRAH